MLSLPVILDGDGAWTDVDPSTVLKSEKIEIAVLENGMASGLPSVAFRIDLPDGQVVVAQTSAVLFLNAARVIAARYRDL